MTAPNPHCGTCSLCCKLPPVRSIDKPGFTWCKHAKPGSNHTCTIYDHKPIECTIWNCFYLDCLLHGTAPPFDRPDRTHYVVDMSFDVVGWDDRDYPAVQVWEDPAYKGAWRDDKRLRRFIHDAAEKNVLTLIRHTPIRGTVILAPPLVQEWTEIRQDYTMNLTDQQKVERLGNLGLETRDMAHGKSI